MVERGPHHNKGEVASIKLRGDFEQVELGNQSRSGGANICPSVHILFCQDPPFEVAMCDSFIGARNQL